MKDMQFTHKWVLVTGASSGLGLEMATQLAEQHQANLILVARREAQLLALKQRLEQSSGIQCHVIAADLSLADDVERVYQQATQLADIYGVILNAGVTHFGEHHELAWPDFEKMLAL
ncbi:MAG TPA: SDR family NAD(P)-dependent oxidoreductase, partial [Agitococcus sp.]|nr:SDR family NAD(P)-dependent oxidoreductase [Agitococcus sp.]HNN29087.1 SDR family NAD(P)-dependent oxidoreductase [Agitococcus sp.]